MLVSVRASVCVGDVVYAICMLYVSSTNACIHEYMRTCALAPACPPKEFLACKTCLCLFVCCVPCLFSFLQILACVHSSGVCLTFSPSVLPPPPQISLSLPPLSPPLSLPPLSLPPLSRLSLPPRSLSPLSPTRRANENSEEIDTLRAAEEEWIHAIKEAQAA